MIKSIENEFLKVSVKTKGGELISIFNKKDNIEMMYQPLKNSWASSDVCIFPFVARLKDQSFRHNGVKYDMDKHGLVRYNEVEIEDVKSDEITFSFKSNEETLKSYPFEFDYKINYKLNENKIKVTYSVKNTGNNTMFYGIGGHPAIICDGAFGDGFTYADTSIKLDVKEINKVKLTDDGCYMIEITKEDFPREFEVNKALFQKEKTLILKVNGFKLDLHSNTRNVSFESDATFVAFWSDEVNGNYVCVEPWWALPDFVDADSEISKKNTILSLDANCSKDYSYTIEIK